MTDTYELVGSIRAALTQIADYYDRSLDGPRQSGTVGGATGTKEAPIPVPIATIEIRKATRKCLRYWVGFIYDEVRDADNGHIRTIVDGDDIPAMCSHVDRWADILAGQWPGEAEDLRNEARKHGKALKHLAVPERREWMPIGECPVTVADADGNSVPCGHQVRAYDRTEEDTSVAYSSGGDKPPGLKLKRIQFIECPGCGTEDTLSWWMSQIVPEGSDRATASEVIAFVAMRAGMVLHHEQLRQWASRGFIRRHGKDTKGRTLYSSAAVLAYAQSQTKEDAA